MNQHSFDLEQALFPKQKPGPSLGFRGEQSSIMNSSVIEISEAMSIFLTRIGRNSSKKSQR